jgi:phosphatidylinositol alpha 1,6-mannosyltransferase
VIVGDGPDRAELEGVFIGQPVTFAGALHGEELADAYRACDAFVHCGEEETFGQTIQEAKASGLPVVVANRGGPRHLIRDGEDGFLVEPGRWGAYRDVVKGLMADSVLRESVGRAARRSVEGKSWRRNNDELLAHYRFALASLQPRTRAEAA